MCQLIGAKQKKMCEKEFVLKDKNGEQELRGIRFWIDKGFRTANRKIELELQLGLPFTINKGKDVKVQKQRKREKEKIKTRKHCRIK